MLVVSTDTGTTGMEMFNLNFIFQPELLESCPVWNASCAYHFVFVTKKGINKFIFPCSLIL